MWLGSFLFSAVPLKMDFVVNCSRNRYTFKLVLVDFMNISIFSKAALVRFVFQAPHFVYGDPDFDQVHTMNYADVILTQWPCHF